MSEGGMENGDRMAKKFERATEVDRIVGRSIFEKNHIENSQSKSLSIFSYR